MVHYEYTVVAEDEEMRIGMAEPSKLHGTSAELRSLFLQYLHTCNMALKAHQEEFPYKVIYELGEQILGQRNINVAVYTDRPENPTAAFTIRLADGQFDVVAHEQLEPDIDWTVSVAYLNKVVDHAEDYIQHPRKLEWEWLKDRLGLQSQREG